jgi:hypothetical protein
MLVTPESSRRNRNHALTLVGVLTGTCAIAGWFGLLRFSLWSCPGSPIGWFVGDASGG